MIARSYIPSPHLIVRESIIVLGGLLLAAFILSRFPKLKAFVTAQSLTVNDTNNNNLF